MVYLKSEKKQYHAKKDKKYFFSVGIRCQLIPYSLSNQFRRGEDFIKHIIQGSCYFSVQGVKEFSELVATESKWIAPGYNE